MSDVFGPFLSYLPTLIIYRQNIFDLPTYLNQILSDAARHTYYPKDLTSHVNSP